VNSWAVSKEQTKVSELLKAIQDFRLTSGALEEEAEIQRLNNIQNVKRRHQTETQGMNNHSTYHPNTSDHPMTRQLNNTERQSDALLENVDKKLHLKEAHQAGPEGPSCGDLEDTNQQHG
jgi:hypothetical protein